MLFKDKRQEGKGWVIIGAVTFGASLFFSGPDDQAKAAKNTADEAECRKSIQCWGDKHNIEATFKCDDAVESLAKYSFQWIDKWHEPKFGRFRWKDQAAGQVTYMGDRIQFQNGFGAYQVHSYYCDYDPGSRTVLSVSARPGSL